MISEIGVSECYVYIMLPGADSFTTAGRLAIEKDEHDIPQGRFVYGRSYLENPDAIPIDPIVLNRLHSAVYGTAALKGVFGALRDAGPDHWGRRIIEKRTRLQKLGEIDYLLHSADDRAGALGFGRGPKPPAPNRKFNRTLDLEKLMAVADALIADEESAEDSDAGQIRNLMLINTSMGGARPKAVIEDAGELWLAKFNRSDDLWNHARVEHAMLELAKSCGISSAQSRVETVAGRDVLLVKRFDREKTYRGFLRFRMISGLTALRTEDTHQNRERWSYTLLSEELRRIVAQPGEDASELFKRMAFNALISNTDDHPRNHAFIAKGAEWKLSPAYDLTPSRQISLEQRDLAMSCGIHGRYANARNMLTECGRFLLLHEEAAAIIDEMEDRVRNNWYGIARKAGVSEADCMKINGAFAYPGFRFDPSNLRGGR